MTSRPCTTTAMRRFLRRVKLSNKRYLEWTGGQTLAGFIKANPTWTQAKWQQLVRDNLHWLLNPAVWKDSGGICEECGYHARKVNR